MNNFGVRFTDWLVEIVHCGALAELLAGYVLQETFTVIKVRYGENECVKSFTMSTL